MTTKTNTQAKKAHDAMIKALKTRLDFAEQTNNDNAIKKFTTELNNAMTITQIDFVQKIGFDVEKFAKQISITDKKHADFVAQNVVTKVRFAVLALAQGLKSGFDGYTRTILENLTIDAQNNKSAMVSLSRAITFNEFDTQHRIIARYNCEANTSDTQTSSTRQLLRFMQIAPTTKGKRNDEFAMLDNAITARVREVFAK